MKTYFLILLATVTLSVNAQINTITVGAVAPEFNLKNVDNKMVSFKNYPAAKGFIVVFTCNTCPYSKAYENRIIALNTKFSGLGYPVIAINPNDPAVAAGDSFEKMQELAKAKKFNFPYLFDPAQTVANLYGAKSTPHLFVVQKTNKGLVVQYTGAIDNDTEETNPQRTNYVADAINSLIANKKPVVPTTKAIGCTVRRAK